MSMIKANNWKQIIEKGNGRGEIVSEKRQVLAREVCLFKYLRNIRFLRNIWKDYIYFMTLDSRIRLAGDKLKDETLDSIF